MAIFVTGDTHGQEQLRKRLAIAREMGAGPGDYLLICGDCGCIWDQIRPDGSEPRREKKFLDSNIRKGPTVLFVPGNHENYDRLVGLSDRAILSGWPAADLSQEAKRALCDGYPRKKWHGGTVREIRPWFLMLEDSIFDLDDFTLLAIGGAPSHDIQDGILDPMDYPSPMALDEIMCRMFLDDKMFRVKHVSWWPQEVPQRKYMDRFLASITGKRCDAIVTHDMPDAARREVGFEDSEPMSDFLQEIKDAVEYGNWYCGHYHADIDLPDNIHLLYHDVRRIN